ncbi:MAG: GGDEF and EAL domain-containing protein [Elainella sp. Prado103]|nr:GGDEF and EAL domain-containing protein [Elainella sp. Prado103]
MKLLLKRHFFCLSPLLEFRLFLESYWQQSLAFVIAGVIVLLFGLAGLGEASESSLQSLLLQWQILGWAPLLPMPVEAFPSWSTSPWLLGALNLLWLGGTAQRRWFHQLGSGIGLCALWIGLWGWLLSIDRWLPLALPLLWFGSTVALLMGIKFLAAFYTLRRNETRYALMMQGFNEGIWEWDLRADRCYFSPRWKQMVGYDEAEICDQPQEWFDRVHPLDRSALDAALADYLNGQTAHFEQDYRLLHQDGQYRWMQSRGLAIYHDGKAVRLLGSQVDVTAQKQAEEELWRSTFFDRLTELPSWTGFVHQLQQVLAAVPGVSHPVSQPHPQFAVLWLDLDQFKLVNNSLGKQLGDRLLLSIAQRLKSFLPSEIVARLGEDEFAILLRGVADGNDAIHAAQQIQQVLTYPFRIGEQEIFVTASVGIALSAPHYHKPESLLRDAGTAMYRAKSMGRASCLVFDPSMRTGMLVKLRLENDLRRAIAQGERQHPTLPMNSAANTLPFKPAAIELSLVSRSEPRCPDSSHPLAPEGYPELELYYQPIVRLATGEVAGFEALVRWQHAEQGLLFPSRFISMAEETGLIIPLSWWILRTACRQMSQWRQQFPDQSDLTMSVNLSSKQFSMPGLTAQIQQILQEVNLEPTYLKLELTESMVMENVSSVVDVLYQLRALGIRLAIDDFGTGYSSLSYLPRFPLTTLKIDRSFVNQIGNCRDNLEIVRTILSLAHKLRMDVVAEGVETESQSVRLQEMGCEFGQGFFFHKPLAVDAATRLLRDSRSKIYNS